MTPSAAIQATGPAVGRKPMSSATPATMATLIVVRIKLPRTCPVSTEARAIAKVRKRAMMPSFMSMTMFTAVVSHPVHTVMTRIPGATKLM